LLLLDNVMVVNCTAVMHSGELNIVHISARRGTVSVCVELHGHIVYVEKLTTYETRVRYFAGTLKLDISPCPPDVKNCLTPELYKVDPYPDNHVRPIKEIVEFPVRDILEPYTTYRSDTYTPSLA